MDKEQFKKFTEWLREEVNKTSYAEVGRKIGSSAAYVHNLLNGRFRSLSVDKLDLFCHAYPRLRQLLGIYADCFNVSQDDVLNYKGVVVPNISEKVRDAMKKMRQTYNDRELSQETGVGESVINNIFNRKGNKVSRSTVILAIRNSRTVRKMLGLDDGEGSQVMINSPQGVQVGESATYYNGEVTEAQRDVNTVLDLFWADLQKQLLEKAMELNLATEDQMKVMRLLIDTKELVAKSKSVVSRL